MHDDEVQ